MAPPTRTRPIWLRRRAWRGASAIAAVAAIAIGGLLDVRPASAQKRGIVTFPTGQSRPAAKAPPSRTPAPKAPRKEPMLVRADEIHYDYTNERVAAVGNVQIYYAGSTLEADKVIYDQKTKRLHAEGNVRLTEPDGKITYGDIIDLSDDYRDGFVDSLRLDMPEQTRFAAKRADRHGGNITVFQNGVYTACEPCKDDPQEAAEMAGQGRPDHPRSGREDDVFRGRAARILRLAACLDAVFLGARSDGASARAAS